MPRKLTQLPKTSFSGLEYDNIIEDIINLVKDNPEFNENWSDFLSSNAGRMIIELFAYITDQLATRIDWVVNENWIGTATQKRSVMRILKLIGYNFALPYAAQVPVDITIPASEWPGEFYLTEPYDASVGVPNIFSITGTDKNGNQINFELLPYDSVNQQYDYKTGVKIESSFANGNTGMKYFYEGKTYVEDFTVETDNAPSFTVSNAPVIEKSVRVYLVQDTGSGVIETELKLVDSFLEPDAQNSVDDNGNPIPIPYIVNVNEDETITIEFGSSSILPSPLRRLSVGDKIKIFYRVGGGVNGNIIKGAINSSKTISVIPIGQTNSVIIHPTLINNSEGTGGKDSETIEHARSYAPLTIRTVKKAVTNDDYDILINSHSSILTAKTYGASNMPNTVWDLYHQFIKPLEAWIYAVPDKTGWRNANPSEYNDIEWISLRYQNMFNEQWSFREGEFNLETSVSINDIKGNTSLGDTINPFGTGDTKFYNYIILNTSDDLKNSWNGNKYFRLKASNSSDDTQQFKNIQDLIIGDSIHNGDTGDSVWEIKENINAYYKSLIDISSGVDLSVDKNIQINIDNKGDVIIDMSTEAINPANTSPSEIMAAINKQLYTAYGDSLYGDTSGLHGIASVEENKYIKLTSPKQGDSSSILFKPVSNDATEKVFGKEASGDTRICFGTKKLTFIINQSSEYFQKVIYQLGTLTLDYENDTFYLHYIKTENSEIPIGTYYNSNYQPTDLKYREVAKRIYNNINKEGTNEPDLLKSKYQLKFTKTPTKSMSLYAIKNDWDLKLAEQPYIYSIDFRGDTITVFNSSNYNIKIDIDGKGEIEIDITADKGIKGDTSYYLLDSIISNINQAIGDAYASIGEPYSSYLYAVKDGYKIKFRSPTANNNSSIKILVPSVADATNELFGLAEGDSYIYYPAGDYYLDYDSANDRMKLIKITCRGIDDSNVPDGNFYVHFIWDRTYEDTDEDIYQKYLENTKLVGIENVFKQTKFSTFDIFGKIYYKKTYSISEVKDAVEKTLHNTYDFVDEDGNVNRDHGKPILRSKVLQLIQNIDGVEYVIIDYFGKDQTDPSTNMEHIIECDFDEILILSENSFNSQHIQIHGIKFDYTVFEED